MEGPNTDRYVQLSIKSIVHVAKFGLWVNLRLFLDPLEHVKGVYHFSNTGVIFSCEEQLK